MSVWLSLNEYNRDYFQELNNGCEINGDLYKFMKSKKQLIFCIHLKFKEYGLMNKSVPILFTQYFFLIN